MKQETLSSMKLCSVVSIYSTPHTAIKQEDHFLFIKTAPQTIDLQTGQQQQPIT